MKYFLLFILLISGCAEYDNHPPKDPYFTEVNGQAVLCQYVFHPERDGGGDDWWELKCEEI